MSRTKTGPVARFVASSMRTAAEVGIAQLPGAAGSAGRLCVARWPEELRVIGIAPLLPEFRRRGIGGELLRGLLEEGRSRGVPVRIHVKRQNPALALYERLGFRVLEDRGVYLFLEWRAAAAERPDADPQESR